MLRDGVPSRSGTLRRSDSKRVLLFQVYSVWRGVESDMRLPLGMLYLGGSLRNAGYHVEVFHIEETEVDRTLASVDCSDVLFVGLCSVLTGFSLRCAIKFSKRLKQLHPDLPIVWGGVQPTAIPEACVREPFVDAVGLGDGDELIVDIARMFNGLLEPSQVTGLAYSDERGNPIVNERRMPIRLDEYEPDYSLIDLNRYIFNRRITGLMMSSRGCPFECTFCYNNYFSKRRWRKHSSDYVVQTLDELRKQYDFDTFSFSDDLFFVDRKRAIRILRAIHEMGLRTFAVDVKVNYMGDDEIRAVGEFGVESVFFGLESLNPRLIQNMKKQQDNEQIFHMLRRFAELAPDVSLSTGVLMGLPYERKAELRQDIHDCLELTRLNPNLSVYFGNLFPLPATEMMDAANLNGFRPETVYDYAEIDLNNAWKLSNRWLLFDVSKRERRALRLTEEYSQILSLPVVVWAMRRDPSLHARLLSGVYRGLFAIACFRVRHWVYAGHGIDFWLVRWSASMLRIALAPLHPVRSLLGLRRRLARLRARRNRTLADSTAGASRG